MNTFVFFYFNILPKEVIKKSAISITHAKHYYEGLRGLFSGIPSDIELKANNLQKIKCI